jgi:putative phosphoribosyl transferase
LLGADDEDSDRVIQVGGSKWLKGYLDVPYNAKGLVIFCHGSGSGRNSTRNHFVAKVLNEAGFATALFDLLTEDEAREDEKTRKLRFDIGLLTERLTKITKWVQKQQDTSSLKIGYYGASTGAASALVAAAEFGNAIKAIVSRGGRVDLASHVLKRIDAKTSILLLVGSNDPSTVQWNQKVMHQLKQVVNKRLLLVQGAGHLFEEKGMLEEVAKHSASWFIQYLN